MKIKAAFLDRDGTINKNYGYVFKKEKFKLLKNVIPAFKLLKRKNYKIFVISNQSGISRGYFNKIDVINLHNWFNFYLKKFNLKVEHFYFCSYHPKYSKKSKYGDYMRKPNPGMILKAAKEYNIDLHKSFFIGDKKTDQEAAKKAKINFVLKKHNLLVCVKKALNNFED